MGATDNLVNDVAGKDKIALDTSSKQLEQQQRQQQQLPKASKPRIDCIDGTRFALVMPIIVGHFIKYGTRKTMLLKLLTQENVFVGGFFLISGYVSAYVSTKVGERECEQKKLARPELFFWQKTMSFYPLHFLVSTLFSPMFVATDVWMNNSRKTTVFHGILNYTLSQAWFPSEAEIWNPPTWFLSALTFANFTMPTMVLPQVARLSKEGLSKLIYGLGALSLLQKVSYSQAWQYHCRGEYICRTNTPHLWNVTRFHPFWALVEVAMGVAAARDVMLDGTSQQSTHSPNPLWYFLASYASVALRITKFNLNDAMIRSAFFVPLYLKFLQAMHRDCLTESPRLITRFFGSRLMARLGALAFPMFILHGPIGQLFYKKAVATRLWGRVMPKKFFPAYLLIVMLSGHVVNEVFVKSKRVQRLSARLAQILADRTHGMLQDQVSGIESSKPAGSNAEQVH
mmetsp:Transcript_57444/g.145856  ORF Transcript_57444/g.145856 Transcript_57444/m.145856 type:complete len:456 (+) Transcript_57444:64-1431(+)